MNNEGLIIKATGGFYYVKCGGSVIECRARGIFRKERISPLVGDMAEIMVDGDTGTVMKILTRKNELNRPPVANLDRLLIVSSTVSPPPDIFAIDKLAAIAEYKGIEPVIVLTKADLEDSGPMLAVYGQAGFRAFAVSSVTGEGVQEITALLQTGISAVTGNSGVGKSSLLNSIAPKLFLEVGGISHKLGRGRQTTRTVELFPLRGGGYVADTPGFSSIDIVRAQTILKDELQFAFRDFAPFLDNCRFTGCSHTKEKGCAVLEAVRSGVIGESRHASYCAMYEEVKDLREWNIKSRNETENTNRP
jgi:ribosome biogenesis GTPase